LGGFGANLGGLGANLGGLGANLGRLEANLGRLGANLGPEGSQNRFFWIILGSILGSFLVDFGHRFWTKKPLKIYEENCSQKVCENVIKMTSKLSNKSIK
jgi:hypothetical protein